MHELGYHELENFFRYHRTFNYPLSGEFSFVARLARGINIDYDWWDSVYDDPSLMSNGVHPNSAGYAIMADQIFNAMETLLAYNSLVQ